MARSKLERFRDEHFPVDFDDPLADGGAEADRFGPRPVPARTGRPPRKARSGLFERTYRGLKIALMLLPLGFLLVTAVVACGPGASSSIPEAVIPEFLRKTACTRQDLARHALSIEGTLRTVSERLR